jgi:hypothetical protein
MTTRRERILDNIKTTLAYITVAHGYNTTVVTTSETVKDWDAVSTGEMPWLGFCSDPREGTIFEQEPNGRICCYMNIAIVGHIIALPGATKNQLLSNLEADIIKAMYSDHTRGRYAIDTKLNTSLTDEGDDMIYPNKPTGTIIQTWTVKYFITTTNQS